MNTAEFLTISAAIVPDRTAVVGADRRSTYGEVQSIVNRLANGLRGLGVSKGQNVRVMTVNRPEFQQQRFPDLSLDEVRGRVSRFRQLLGIEAELCVEQLSSEIFELSA